MAAERTTGQPTAAERAANERAATERTAGERTTGEPAADEWASGERAPLSAAALSGPLARPGSFWQSIAVTPLTGSTNADLLAQAGGGAPEGSVLVAEAQTAGRGRMGRAWLSPPGAGLMFSVLLRPGEVPPARRGWVPLLTGVAIASAVRDLTGLDARLKWPNDVLVGDRKLAGILAEQSADAIVVGAGINVSTRQAELPVETATSLALEVRHAPAGSSFFAPCLVSSSGCTWPGLAARPERARAPGPVPQATVAQAPVPQATVAQAPVPQALVPPARATPMPAGCATNTGATAPPLAGRCGWSSPAGSRPGGRRSTLTPKGGCCCARRPGRSR